jgi:CHRD domain
MSKIRMSVIGAVLVGVMGVAGATRAGAQMQGFPGAQATSTPRATATPGISTAQRTATPVTTGATTTQQNIPLTAALIGAAEVPGPGDPDAVGAAAVTLDSTAGMVCYALHVVNIATPATAAHIHEGAVGVAGPIVVPFTAPTGGDSSGCVQAERDLITRLQQNPAGFYVNVHNPDYPEGAARGQLGR